VKAGVVVYRMNTGRNRRFEVRGAFEEAEGQAVRWRSSLMRAVIFGQLIFQILVLSL